MKLRIHGDSIRFRLTQGEVARLRDGASVTEFVHFSASPDDVLTYSLHTSERAEARFLAGEIRVELPRAAVERWATGDDVGIESTQATGEGKALRIIVEKDFRCLQPRPGEDERDHFPHPDAAGSLQT